MGPTHPVTISTVQSGENSGWLTTEGSFYSFALIERHGVCLYFARDGLPAHYGKVVAALML